MSEPSISPGAVAGSRSLQPAESTIPLLFEETREKHAGKPALMFKQEGKYQPITYAELWQRINRVARGLLVLGVEAGDRVAILSENRPEWAIADLAILHLGAINVPLYTTLTPPQCDYIVRNSGSSIWFVSNEKQLDKALAIRNELPELRKIVVFDAPSTLPENVLSLADLERLGQDLPHGDEEVEKRWRAVRPGDLATIIYTSGTTGNPKGAVLTHNNFASNAQAVRPVFLDKSDDVFLSFLPLSHVFERMAGHYLPLTVGATVAYAESIMTVQNNMVEVRPTIMPSVPRLYEAMESRIRDQLKKLPDLKRKAAEWALDVGWEYHRRRIAGESIPATVSIQYKLADKKVLSEIRSRLHGGRLRFFVSGGAPLPVETARFLISLGVHILEGYGLTETSPVICINLPEKTKVGTVGPPIPGVEVKIAVDGEILSRGPHIMTGYHAMPEATAEAIDPEGWFHTGDIGCLDEDGYLAITGRKKDIIVLANGKNVAPQVIEEKLKASPYIANVVLFGDRETQIVGLVIPDFQHLKGWAATRSLPAEDLAALVRSPEVKKLVRGEIDRLTQDIADYERVRRFTVLDRELAMDRDELTPTLKIKRRVVAEHFADEIRALYGGRKDD